MVDRLRSSSGGPARYGIDEQVNSTHRGSDRAGAYQDAVPVNPDRKEGTGIILFLDRDLHDAVAPEDFIKFVTRSGDRLHETRVAETACIIYRGVHPHPDTSLRNRNRDGW